MAVERLHLGSLKIKSRHTVKSNKSNLKEEEQLAEKVRKFPCFYAKEKTHS